MNIFQKLVARPWLPEQTNLNDVESGGFAIPAEKVALRAFLAVITSMFMLFTVAYIIRMDLSDWRPLPEPALLWANSLVLVLSSFAFQWARSASEREDVGGVRKALSLAGVLTIVFLAGQFGAWLQLGDSGYFAVSNPANAFFYLITGIHAAHLVGGLCVWQRTMWRAWHSQELASVNLSIELCTVYWQYLLLVWLALFGLLLST
jgi:cytochrome c oxidase subunit 3